MVYNWVHRSVDGGDYRAMFNMVNNYYKPGPLTPRDTPVGHRILKPEAGRSKLDYKVYGRVYADGNIMEGYPEITKDNWNGGIQVEDQADTKGYTEQMRTNVPFVMPYINIMSATEAYDYVLANAGANIPRRDIITDIRQVGGYPEYKGTPYVDTDGDGMPDEWEVANGLNPNDPNDANEDCTGDGYTNIEKYINGISTKNKVDWTDLKNNYDTLAGKGKLM